MLSRSTLVASILVSSFVLGVPGAGAEQAASKQRRAAAAHLDVGGSLTCAVLGSGKVRCWGKGDLGGLGYGNTEDIGDNELPDTVGLVNLGAGRTATAISADEHVCVILDTQAVRCWGQGSSGQLGYGNTDDIGDSETPNTVGPVNLGAGRKATAITTGAFHTCVILDTAKVKCWGYAPNGQLGYGNIEDIGDNETPNTVGTVNLGGNAAAIAAGGDHVCAILVSGAVRCWGSGSSGELGYGNTDSIGDTETPNTVGPVSLGAGRKATAIASGLAHTCAILDNGRVRCWGFGGDGRLGYGTADSIGDTELPSTVGPVDLGPGRTAVAIAAGDNHTCAILDNGTVRCWGNGALGRLGYGNTTDIGDTESPASVGPVDLGLGRTAVAISAGAAETCVVLDNGRIRCWGDGDDGRLGYGNLDDIGDTETPATIEPVSAGGTIPAKTLPAVSLALKAKRDRSSPYRLTARGKLTGFAQDTATCSGNVVVKAKKGKKTVRKSVKPKLTGGACSYSATLTVKSTGQWKVTAAFAGNSSLKARTSAKRTFRAG